MATDPSGDLPENVCGICRRPLTDTDERAWCFAALHPTSPLTDGSGQLRGGFIEMGFVTVSDFTPLALVTAWNSAARKQGIDLVFQCCGADCCGRLASALEGDLKMYENLGRD